MQKLTIHDAPQDRIASPDSPGYKFFSGYLMFAIGFTVACGFGLVSGNTGMLCVCCLILLIATYVVRDVWVQEILVNFEKWKAEERTKEKNVRNVIINPKHAQVQYDFTSDDFDDAAKAFLVSQVRQAKKLKSKVSGQSLVENFLRSVR